jgi:hypothetical protein
MGNQHEERDRDARSGEEQEIDPASGRKPVYLNTNPHFAQHTLRERGAPTLAWPLGRLEAEYEAVASRHLEQVGRILRRLDLDQAEILRLRSETRAILAELAA